MGPVDEYMVGIDCESTLLKIHLSSDWHCSQLQTDLNYTCSYIFRNAG